MLLLTKGPFMYEETNRVPLIIRYPKRIPKNLRIQSLASMVDYAPTLIDYAEFIVPRSMRGRSLREIIDQKASNKKEISWREAVFSESYESYTQRCPIWNITTSRWKYNYYFSAIDELYDLYNDPLELNNLAQDPKNRNLLYEMREMLINWAKVEGNFSSILTTAHTSQELF